MRFARKLRQWAVYWAPGIPTLGGKTVYAEPVEIKVRWEDSSMNMVDATGEKWTSKSAIDSETHFVRLGVLWKGRLVDINADHTKPMLNPGASAIRQVDNIPNLRANEEGNTAFL